MPTERQTFHMARKNTLRGIFERKRLYIWNHGVKTSHKFVSHFWKVTWHPLVTRKVAWLCSVHDSAWLCMTLCNSDSAWLNMTLHGSAWLHMNSRYSVWLCMTLLCATLFDSAWLHVTPCDYALVCMTLCDSVWLCMTLHDLRYLS
jgi:hypothetical protein